MHRGIPEISKALKLSIDDAFLTFCSWSHAVWFEAVKEFTPLHFSK